jgi:hypothetical protein
MLVCAAASQSRAGTFVRADHYGNYFQQWIVKGINHFQITSLLLP